MGRNIFVSYKYADNKVQRLSDLPWNESPKVRNYVDKLQSVLADWDHINLGEKDGESLANFADSTIETSLKEKIFRSSVTVVMISKGMKEIYLDEKDQWIPWEVSYSLREITRSDRTCRMNALLGIVLPDETGSYNWYYIENANCNCTTHGTGQLFEILRSNMFNMKSPSLSSCDGLTIHHGEFSFIKTIKWLEFLTNPDGYLDIALNIKNNKNLYDIKVNLG
jgi:hypothetical protein